MLTSQATNVPLSLSSLRRRLIRIHLLPVLVVPNSWWGCSVPSAFPRSDSYDLAVDSAGDAVLELEVHFGDGIVGEDGGVGYITCSQVCQNHPASCKA